MMRPGPALGNRAIHHRTKRARLMRSTFIDVDDEAGQHQERRQIVNHITDRDNPSSHDIVEPHQQPGNQKQYPAHRNGPEIKFLTGIEEPDVLRLEWVFISDVLPHSSHPASIGFDPCHRRKPVDELKQEKNFKQQSKPRMKRARSWAATEYRR